MSLHPEPIEPVPAETARVARAAFPRGNACLQLRDMLGSIYDDTDFLDLFPRRGQAAEAPWRLALVTVLQFAEGLSDRQAADAVRGRIDWKYACQRDRQPAPGTREQVARRHAGQRTRRLPARRRPPSCRRGARLLAV